MSQPSLLGLPVELRLQILGYLILVGPQAVHAEKRDPNDCQIPCDYEWRHPTILRANQQIYNEGFSLLYNGEEFEAVIDEKGLHVCQCLYPNMSKQLPKLHTNFENMTSLDIYLKVPEPDMIGDSHRKYPRVFFQSQQMG